jgi:GDP-D-mannose dehydratase
MILQISKIALITGVTGQDGVYLAEFLLEKANHWPNRQPCFK